MTRTHRSTALLAAAVLIACLAAVPAAAAPTWLPSGPVGPAFANAFNGTVAVDSAGNAVALWPATAGAQTQIQASSRPAGGVWGAPVPLSAPGAAAVFPEVVLADDGTATAVWFRMTGALTFGLQSATRGANGLWSPAVDLAGGSASFDQAALGLLPGGGAIVVWPRFADGFWYESTSMRAPGGAWSSPLEVSAGSGSDPGRPALGIDAAGNTTVVWSRHNGTNAIIETRTLRPGGVWSAVEPLSQAGQDAIDPSVAVDAAGTATAVWARSDGTRDIAQSSSRTATGAPWSSPVNLSASALSVSNPEVATSGSGRVVATWSAKPDMGTRRVQAAIREPGAAWGPAVGLSDIAADAVLSRVVVAANGVSTVVWNWSTGAVNVVQGASAAAGSAFAAAATLSPDLTRDSFQPRLAVDSHGDVAVFWVDLGTTDFQARYAAYDVAGPVLGTVTAPTTGTAGKALSYAASATDTWSSVASYAWSFGDGKSATGPTVKHTYAKKGSYSATLTVTDAVGNTTTRTTTTKVATPVPRLKKFVLTENKIQALSRAVAKKTKLKVRLNTKATLKLVFKSKHRHVVKGKKRFLKVVRKLRLPQGLTRITIKGRVSGKFLAPDSYVITGTAKNTSGTSPKKTVKLTIVEA